MKDKIDVSKTLIELGKDYKAKRELQLFLILLFYFKMC